MKLFVLALSCLLLSLAQAQYFYNNPVEVDKKAPQPQHASTVSEQYAHILEAYGSSAVHGQQQQPQSRATFNQCSNKCCK